MPFANFFVVRMLWREKCFFFFTWWQCELPKCVPTHFFF